MVLAGVLGHVIFNRGNLDGSQLQVVALRSDVPVCHHGDHGRDTRGVVNERMSTQKETVEFLLEKLRHPGRFSTRAMFGEYALYADGKVVALVCDDQLFVKIVPASIELEGECEFFSLSSLSEICLASSNSLSALLLVYIATL